MELEMTKENVFREKPLSASLAPPDPLDLQQATTSSGACVICEQPAHGIHFGVLSCRACAAFFRRTIVLRRKFACRRFSEQCTISKEARYLCRYCRFQKCLKSGMTPDNVVFPKDYDHSPSTPESSDTKSAGNGAGSPSPAPSTPSIDQTPSSGGLQKQPRFTLVLQPAARKLFEIFKTYKPLEKQRDASVIQQLAIATLSLKLPADFKFELQIAMPMNGLSEYYSAMICDCAKWMQHMHDFVDLDLQDKFAILRNCWCAVHRLLNIAESLERFGDEVFEQEILIAGERLISAKKSYITQESTTDPLVQENYVAGMRAQIELIARPMYDMGLTHMELAFLLGMTLWKIQGCEVSEKAIRVAECFRDNLANEMYAYYTSTRQLPNYAHRLIRLMEILQENENIQRVRSETWAMLRTFDLVNMEIDDYTVIDPKRM